MADAKTALIVIDAQQEYFAPAGKVVLPGGPAAAKKIAEALAWARQRKLPVIHVVHESRRPNAPIFAPGSPALEIHPDARPAPVTVLSDATAAMAVKGPDGETIPAEQVHKTHLGSLSGFLAEVKSVKDIAT